MMQPTDTIHTRTFSDHIKSSTSIECFFINHNRSLPNTPLSDVKTPWRPSLTVRVPTQLGDLVPVPEKLRCLPCSVLQRDTRGSSTFQMKIPSTRLPRLFSVVFRHHDETRLLRRRRRRLQYAYAALEFLVALRSTSHLLYPRQTKPTNAQFVGGDFDAQSISADMN